MHFWNNGVHYFKPGVSSNKVANDIIKPFKTRELYITGEAYSKRQAWIEGALQTSDIVIRKILNSNQVGSGLLNIDSLPTITKKKSYHDTIL